MSVPSVPTCFGLHSEGWSFADVDGDRRVDLVSPANSCNDVVWSWATPYWKVYRNTGGSFGASFTQHAVPRRQGAGVASVHSGGLSHG